MGAGANLGGSVRAERREVDLRLPAQGLPLPVLRGQAEALARAATQEAFDREVLVSQVSVKVTLETERAAAPLLQVNVSRANWLARPDVPTWGRYFLDSATLLGLER
ncbi:MAG: hypothetical protein HC918_12300 [Oscillatoriales cyanobacterium SM2_1_8]|nr:hypothetical protein [Oscillatoriales cyanobacterium SM2_1_8]